MAEAQESITHLPNTMDGYMTRKKAAAYAGCCLRKFDLKIRPYVRAYKFGGTPMFRKEDIDAWASSQQVVSTSRAVVGSTAYGGRRRARGDAPKSALELRILRKLDE